jgi:hypothetical protein
MTSPATNVAASVGALIVAVGGAPALTVIGSAFVVLTPSETASRTVYCPGWA